MLVSSRPEPEWDELEQAWMLALREYRASLCPNCNGYLPVTAAAENEDRFKPGLPLQCFRCVGTAQAHDTYADHPQAPSLLHLVPQRPSRP